MPVASATGRSVLRRPSSRAFALFARLALGALSTCLSLLIAEVALRLLAPQEMMPPLLETVQGIRVPRAHYDGQHVVPGTYSVRITTNGQRFRDPKGFSSKPAPGTVRIAMLGDSGTFGYGANDSQTYPARLEQLLNDGHPGSLEVINAGIPATGTADQALYFEHWVRKFYPAIVVVNVFANDIEDNVLSGPLPESSSSGKRTLSKGKEASDFLLGLPPIAFVYAHSQVLSLLRSDLWLWSRREPMTPARTEAGLEATAHDLSWLERRVSASGAKLVIVLLPSRSDIYEDPGYQDARKTQARLSAVLAETCGRLHVPFLDATREVRNLSEASGRALFYAGRDTHPTPAGYAVFAQVVSTFLASTEGTMRSR